MTKEHVIENYRVEVEFDKQIYYVRSNAKQPTEHDFWIKGGKNLIDEINRHCDGVKRATVIFDSYDICGFCGHKWENALDEDGCPICCEEAKDEWEKEQHYESKDN